MKTTSTFLLATILAASTIGSVQAQDHQHGEGTKDQATDIMADPGSRSMMMDSIAHSPEMRDQMMKKMMQSMEKDSAMGMHQMMNDPEMKKRMQKHLDMMQAMLNSEGMSQEGMKAMMEKPEMQSMMKMHMMCSKMMGPAMMDEHSKSAKENHAGMGHSG